MSSPIFDATFGTGRFKSEEPMTTDPTTSPSPEPQDVREALNEALRFLDKIDHWVSAKYATLAARKICDVLEKLPALAQSDAGSQDVREALADLVKWKDYKDKHGADATYELGKERAWRKARAALAQSDAEPSDSLIWPEKQVTRTKMVPAQSDAESAADAGLIEAAEWLSTAASRFEEAADALRSEYKTYARQMDRWAGDTRERARLFRILSRAADRSEKSEEDKMSGEASAIYDTLDTHTDIEDVKRIARNWMDSATQHFRNEEYYRGVCHEIGETLFGREAHIQDDGGYSESVLVAKLPELAKAAARARAADRSVHGELIPDCPTDGVAARQGNGG
jgi:hypothetical protein